MNFQWPEPLSVYWRGFGGGEGGAGWAWWPLGARQWQTGVIFTPIAIVLASIFVTFPFVARSLIPLMEAQASTPSRRPSRWGRAGADVLAGHAAEHRWGLLYGTVLCTARALGEFGAVVGRVRPPRRDRHDAAAGREALERVQYSGRVQRRVPADAAGRRHLVIKTIAEWKAKRDARGLSGPTTSVRVYTTEARRRKRKAKLEDARVANSFNRSWGLIAPSRFPLRASVSPS
jgi:sulfate transport system permease protein